jgi:hypothetical protein
VARAQIAARFQDFVRREVVGARPPPSDARQPAT